jgi:tRNA dimethylallyltransferase
MSSPGSGSTTAPLFVAGPTASGKSEVALLLAEQLRGEIISVDSMQVYRGLDIGTAKPSAAEQARVRHHLIDLVELTEQFDAAKFRTLAAAAVEDIVRRGRVPIFCGGTGLYFKAFLDGLGDAPPSDPALRAELEATPLEILLRELSERDPATFARIDQRNPRRVVRAVEVIRLTGKPFSDQRAAWKDSSTAASDESSPPLFALRRSTEDLRKRIDRRVDQMFASGLVHETEQALQRGLAGNPNAMQAIGYRQVVEHLRGERSLEATMELVKIRTRQFAKRQMTWFRRQLTVTWVEVGASEGAQQIVERILRMRSNP